MMSGCYVTCVSDGCINSVQRKLELIGMNASINANCVKIINRNFQISFYFFLLYKCLINKNVFKDIQVIKPLGISVFC